MPRNYLKLQVFGTPQITTFSVEAIIHNCAGQCPRFNIIRRTSHLKKITQNNQIISAVFFTLHLLHNTVFYLSCLPFFYSRTSHIVGRAVIIWLPAVKNAKQMEASKLPRPANIGLGDNRHGVSFTTC